LPSTSTIRPRSGIDRFLVGTPPILSLVALEAGLDQFADVELAALRRKSGGARRPLHRAGGAGTGPAAARPGFAAPRLRNAAARSRSGIRRGYPIMQALIARGVDRRFPRAGHPALRFAPLYVSFGDIWNAVSQLSAVMAGGWEWPEAGIPPRARTR